jgi:integrase
LAAFEAAEARVSKSSRLRTINKLLVLTGTIARYAARHGWMERNPAEGVERLRDTRPLEARPIDTNILTPDELRRLFEKTEPQRLDENGAPITNNYRLMIKCAALTGMRQGELLGLQWGDVDWNSKQLFVRRTYKDGAYHEPKTASGRRRIDVPASLIAELRVWRLACPKGDDDLVFPNLDGNAMSPANLVHRGFEPALRRAGLRRIRFHDLRHYSEWRTMPTSVDPALFFRAFA